MDKIDLKGVTLEELHKFAEGCGEPRFRAAQIFDWLYSQKITHRVNALQEMDNIGKDCISKFNPLMYITSLSVLDDLSSCAKATEDRSRDTVHKYIFKTEDNNLIPAVLVADKLILSTQIGCSYNCKFCASGRYGLVRNLTSGEIVDQVVKAQDQLRDSASVAKVEFAGMGEPLANYEAVVKAIGIMRSKRGLNFYLRNISLATCGLVPQIRRLAEGPHTIDLVVSLHAIQDDIRSKLMPVNEEYSIEKLLNAVKYYNRKTGRTIIFDYILIEGLNDSLADAKLLVNRLRGVPVRLRISSYNPIPGTRRSFIASRLSWREQFTKILSAGNINAVLIGSFGEEVKAGYGQLMIKKPKTKKTKKQR